MEKTTSLCFTKDGLLNKEALEYLAVTDVAAVILFGDGSPQAFDQMMCYPWEELLPRIPKLGISKLPLYEVRLVNGEGIYSKPTYFATEDLKIQWISSRICPNYLTISIGDITSQSQTTAQLNREQTEQMCFLAFQMWKTLREAEEYLCFPAVAIDRMTRWTHSLTPQTLDVEMLRGELGLNSLSYHPVTDLLSITVGGDTFSVKMQVLNEFYGKVVLPQFARIGGRRFRITVSVKASVGGNSRQVDMSYGELGRLVEEMTKLTKEKVINEDHPMETEDLLAFSKKLKVSDESCLWWDRTQSIPDYLSSHQSTIYRSGDTGSSRNPLPQPGDLERPA